MIFSLGSRYGVGVGAGAVTGGAAHSGQDGRPCQAQGVGGGGAAADAGGGRPPGPDPRRVAACRAGRAAVTSGGDLLGDDLGMCALQSACMAPDRMAGSTIRRGTFAVRYARAGYCTG